MNRKTVIALFGTLIAFAAVAILVARWDGTRSVNKRIEQWVENLHDSIDQSKSRRRTVTVLKKSTALVYEPEEFSMRFSHGVTFRFKNGAEGRLIIYLPHPATKGALLESQGRKIQRVFAGQRYGPGHGIEITTGSKEEKQLLELVRTSLRAENENEIKPLLEGIEKRAFDWSLWRGIMERSAAGR